MIELLLLIAVLLLVAANAEPVVALEDVLEELVGEVRDATRR